MNDNEFKYRIIRASIIGVCALVGSCSIDGIVTNRMRLVVYEQAIAKGIDPMVASCAMTGNNTICLSSGKR